MIIDDDIIVLNNADLNDQRFVSQTVVQQPMLICLLSHYKDNRYKLKENFTGGDMNLFSLQ